MALVNQTKREINAKIVYYGPGLSGKASNLKHVHAKLKQEFRGAMKAMSVQDARMLFFDFTPPGEANVHGYRVRFHVYTVSGPSVEQAAWKMVLKGVDGIVFVADAEPGREDANRDSLDQLAGYLAGYGQSLGSVPLVFQYNKCDLPGARAQEELEPLLNPSRLPSFRASSLHGEGVLQTLLALVKSVLAELRARGLEGLATAEGLQGIVAGAAPEPAAAAQAAPPAQAAAAPAPPVAEASAPPAQPLSLELSGAPEAIGAGQFLLPLTLRCGEREKTVRLRLSVTLEQD